MGTPRRRARVRRSLPALFIAWTVTSPLLLTGCNPFGADTEEPAEMTAPSTAAEILDRYVTAIGGEQALRALSQRTIEAELLFKAQEGCAPNDPNCIPEDTRGQFMLYLTADARMFRSTVVGEQILQHGFDGTKGWQYQVDPPVLVLEDAEQAAQTREDAVLHWYFDLSSRSIEPAIQESRIEEVSGKQLDGVSWVSTSSKLPLRVLWFDRATGLLHEETEKDELTGAIERRFFSDYREVDGVLVPHRIRQVQAVGGATQEVEIAVNSVHHAEIPTDKFAVPSLPTPEPEPDEILGYLAAARAAVEAAPKDETARIGLARIAFAAAHFDEAAAAAKQTLALSPKDPEAMWILAQTQVLSGDFAAAQKNLARAEKLGLRPDQSARQRAWIALRSGKWSAGGKLLTKAATLAPRDPATPEGEPDPLKASLAGLGERFSAFDGKPLQFGGVKGCTVEVPMDVNADALVVEVDADGETLRLLVDTAAPDLILGSSTAQKMVVGTDAEAPLILGGRFYGRGQVDELAVGPLKITNVPASIFSDPEMAQTTGDEDIDGVLGIRVFGDMQTTLDIENEKLTLVRNTGKCKADLAAQRQGTSVPFWYHEFHHIYVLAEMNGAEGLYLLNSGMRGADLTAHELAYAHAAIGTPAMKQGQVPMVDVKSFRIGDHSAKNLRAAFGFITQIATADGFRLDGMVGIGVLPRGAVTIDHGEHRLYLRRPSKKKSSEPPAADSAAKPESP